MSSTDALCVAPAGSFTLTTFTTPTLVDPGTAGRVGVVLSATTTSAFPICMAGQVFSFPVTMDATP